MLLVVFGLIPLAGCGRRDDVDGGQGGAGNNGAPAAGQPGQPGQPQTTVPGALLSREVVTPAPAGIRAWRVTYSSRPTDAGEVPVSGIILAPGTDVPVPAGGRKVVAFGHGTTGVQDSCAPSRARPPLAAAVWTFPLVRAGYVVTLTDYAGLGTPGEHAIYVAAPEGRAVLDAARAARALTETGAGRDVVLWGYSQGGQAVLAAGALAAGYAPELSIRGVIATAPLADLPASLTTMQRRADGVGYLLLAMIGLAVDDPRIDLDRYLTPNGRRLLTVARTRCADEVTKTSVGSSIHTAFTVDPLTRPPFAAGFARQRDEIMRRMAPTLVLQGDRDEVIRQPVTDGVVSRLYGEGTTVDYRRYPLADHGSILGTSMNDLMRWVAQRFDARPPTVSDICALGTSARK
ncbi:lipase family protein [Candidatus Frankia alpina]|uniref:lipase family protein n=1 Tax=Candidatus Frankia alpina TaxID=2699483 RepID=UPI001F398546|nr:lipase family protein [Candidatus Frankia alpina]